MKRNIRIATIVTGAACVGLVACGPKEGGGKNNGGGGAEISHTTAKQAITGNTRSVSANLTKSVKFVETSDIFSRSAEAAFAGGAFADGDCQGCEPAPEPVEFEVNVELEQETQAATDWLETHIFTEANVEAESGTSVTYLLDGATVCETDGQVDADCAKTVDDLEVRLVVTSPAQGDVDLDIEIGPNRDNPLSLEIHSNLLAAEVDLGGAKGAADHIMSVTGETIELPQTFSGRVRGELSVDGADKATAALSVLSAIKVADGDYTFSMAVAQPAWSVTADGAAQTITGVTNLGEVSGEFLSTSYNYDEATGEETETSYPVKFHLSGMTGTSVLDAVNEVIKLTGFGLGSGTSTIDIDGSQVIAADFNDGGTANATISQGANDAIEVTVDPKIDLSVAMTFADVADLLGGVEDWMLDEVLTVTFDGAASPKASITDAGIEVLEGQLTLSLQNAGQTQVVAAGQCLLDAPPVIDDGTGEETTGWTPLDDFTVGACE